jgi:fatty-acyl-CoA synthase
MLIDRIESAASGTGCLTMVGDNRAERVRWSAIHERARAAAAGLVSRGLLPGDGLVLVADTCLATIVAIQAAWLAGCRVSVLPPPWTVGRSTAYTEALDDKLRALRPAMVFHDDRCASVLPGPGDRLASLESWVAPQVTPMADLYLAPAGRPTTAAIGQLTSGTTGDPKPVAVTAGCLCSNLDAIADRLELDPSRDRLVSWLPLHHDMGLIGIVALGMSSGTDTILAPTNAFVARPRSWLEWMSEFRGTISCAPDAAYGLVTRTLSASSVDLSSWRAVINGSEPVDVGSFSGFLTAARAHGLPESAAACAYGMAEATLAVSMVAPGSPWEPMAVDRTALQRGELILGAAGDPDTTSLARLGPPVRGMELRIRPGDGRSPRPIGEVQLRGSSLNPGYVGTANPIAGEGEWFSTGDIGFVHDAELVICGRAKEVIILGGRTIHPHEVERTVARIPGVRGNNVAAFGVRADAGRESLVVVAETTTSERRALRRVIARSVLEGLGTAPKDVVLVEPRSLPKTTSGKLERLTCRRRYENGEFDVVG